MLEDENASDGPPAFMIEDSIEEEDLTIEKPEEPCLPQILEIAI